MAEMLGQEETVTLESVVISHAFEMMALMTVLEKKGIITKAEILDEIQKMRKA